MTARLSAEAAARLRVAIAALFADPVLRRALRHRPAEGLEALRLAGPRPRRPLPVKHHGLSVWLDDNTLLGAPAAGTYVEPPLDLRLVVYGARPAALLHVPAEDVGGLAAWARERHLACLVSPWSFVPRRVRGKGLFSDLADDMQLSAPPNDGARRWQGVIAARTTDAAALLWLALLFRWDEYVGLLLGYPRCCCEAFSDRWETARARHAGDVAAALLDENEDRLAFYPWQANALARYFGPSTLAHFPCSFNCSATVALVDRTTALLARYESELAEQIIERLNASVLFCDSGVFLFPRSEAARARRGWRVRYEPATVMSTEPNGEAAALLRGGGELVAIGNEDVVRVAGAEMDGQLRVFAGPSPTEEDTSAVLVASGA